LRREAEEDRRRQEAIERARKILRRGRPVDWDDEADPVVAYLRRRGIVFLGPVRPKLGLIPVHPWVEKQGALWVTVHEGPAMIAAVRGRTARSARCTRPGSTRASRTASLACRRRRMAASGRARR
jgi:hypothetical protein